MTFVSDGTNVSTVEVTAGATIGTLPADPTKDGYLFDGWFSDENCTNGNQVTTIDKGSTGDKTLYAKWTPLYSVTVESTTNGIVTPDKSTATEGQTVIRCQGFEMSRGVVTVFH